MKSSVPLFAILTILIFHPTVLMAGDQENEVTLLKAQVASLTKVVETLSQKVAQLEANGMGKVVPGIAAVPTPLTSKTSEKSEGDFGASTSGPQLGKTLSEAEKAALEAEFSGALPGAKPGLSAPGPSLSAASPAAVPKNTGTIPTPAVTWNLPPSSGGAGGGRLRLIDTSVSLLNDYSLSTAGGARFRKLQGGDHDPKNKGFSAPNEEFVLGGVVDENFQGNLILVPKINEKGDTEIEIEEANLSTLALGRGLQARAGTWFQDFGRLNNSHPHTWEFANQPFVYTRLMSKDNMKSPGAQISWLVPAKEYYKLYLSAQSPIGGSMSSFRSNGGNDLSGKDEEHQVGGHAFSDHETEGIRDLVYTTRLETSRMLSDETTIVGGMSFSTGLNATGKNARTNIYGLDLYYKWKPLNNDHGWPFWAWQTEILGREYEANRAPFYSDPTIILPKEHFRDWGFYTQVVRGFKRQWTAGLRLDYANANGNHRLDPLRDRRWRISPNITHYYSEFSKLRYQYDYDLAQHMGEKPEHTFTVQYEINFGAHGAHKF